MTIHLTPRQSTLIHGWLNPKPTLAWEDVLMLRRLTFEFLLTTAKLRPADLVVLQPDPRLWVQHAGAGLKHARAMIMWPANPFTHLGADLADVLSMKLTAVEMVRMDITHAQLVANGMNEQTERLFRFDQEEWTGMMMMVVDISMKLFPSRRDLDLKLAIPDQETECPILQEPIQTAVFESLPRPFCKARPEHKALTLGCSHTFHAMALVYHWSRNRNVLCPICRAGPQGERLVLSQLPRDWRYSLTARIRREKRKDREEAELENFRAAALISQEAMTRTVVSFVIRIEIQALTATCQLMSWRLNTALSPSHDCVAFEVSAEELHAIPPFAEGTVMRFIPFAYSDALVSMMITPSEWFVVGGSMRTSAFRVEFFEEPEEEEEQQHHGRNDGSGGRREENNHNSSSSNNSIKGGEEDDDHHGAMRRKKFKSIRLKLREEEFSSLIVEAYFAANNNHNNNNNADRL